MDSQLRAQVYATRDVVDPIERDAEIAQLLMQHLEQTGLAEVAELWRATREQMEDWQ